jgi:hypothetical protein
MSPSVRKGESTLELSRFHKMLKGILLAWSRPFVNGRMSASSLSLLVATKGGAIGGGAQSYGLIGSCSVVVRGYADSGA